MEHLAGLCFERIAAQVFVLLLNFAETLQNGFHFVRARGIRHSMLESLQFMMEVPGAPVATGIALLCCGEMGEQRADVRVLDGEGRAVAELVAVARGSMIPAGTPLGDEGFAASHLHYPGDYDLALALPVAWRWEHRWERPAPVARIELGVNPLFHLLAVTLLGPGEP